MNRSMDKLRMPQGIFLLADVLLFPLPMLSVWQENYPEQIYSQLSFVQGYLISRTGAGTLPASGFAPFMTVLLVVLPLILAIAAGICSLVEQVYGRYARYVRIAGMAAGCLYLCQLFCGRIFLWPRRLNDAQQYNWGIGMWLLMLVNLVILIMYVVSMLPFVRVGKQGRNIAAYVSASPSQPEKPAQEDLSGMPPVPGKPAPASSLWDVDGMSYTQTDPMGRMGQGMESHSISHTQTEINLAPENEAVMAQPDQGETAANFPPRGVMVGVAGVFAGKEIAFADGETLRLGRDLANDLVFTNASHISRNHCLITWYAQKQKYYIEDRSSNGCFINAAPTRLPKNVEIALEPGTIIDIGDRTNRFRLE